MTNTEIIQAIRNEIDKRYAEYREKMKSDDFTYYEGMADALDLFEQFIDTLESEKPMNPDEAMKELDEKIALVKRRGTWDGVDVDKYMDEVRGREPEKPKDLEEAADNHIRKVADAAGHPGWDWTTQDIAEAFIAGAKWQAEQLLKGSPLPEDTVLFNKGVAEGRRLERDEFEKNRLAACSNQTKEDYDRETDFALGIIKKEHRQPTFSDAINYGMRLQKEQNTREMIMSDGSYFQKCYELGKKDMREQMMKEEVEGEVVKDINNKLAVTAKNVNLDKFKFGQKVHIIIVKED